MNRNPSRTLAAATLAAVLSSLGLWPSAPGTHAAGISTTTGLFTGGDAGEGLDLDGVGAFVHAIDVGSVGGVTVRDATFTDGSTACCADGSSIYAPNQIAPGGWYIPAYGATANDTNIGSVMQSIRYSLGPQSVEVNLPVVAGNTYQLQMLFGEQCCDRGFDVWFERTPTVDNFNPGALHGAANPAQSAVVTHTFKADDSLFTIRLAPESSFGNPQVAPDNNAILNALTLELLSTGAAPAPVVVTNPNVGAFTGGDVGEGLDFDATPGSAGFVHAINLGGPGGQVIRDAAFSDGSHGGFNAPNAAVAAINEIPTWHAPTYGDATPTTDDQSLRSVMESIRWNAAPAGVDLDLGGLTPGHQYKVQLLFTESCCDRGFDVLVDGQLTFDDFAPHQTQGGINNTTQGAVLSFEFFATDEDIDIRLGPAAPFADNNAILGAVTIEEVVGIPEPSSVVLAILGTVFAGLVGFRRRRR